MTVQVLLFARCRELAGAERLTLNLPSDTTAEQLRQELSGACPALAELLPRCAIAINAEFARPDQAITPTDEIAILPPVSGG